ncbi:hypothetical protein [Natronolimnohabitans innermongolicus]|uniref:Uncharacterized protein n=1 Tax=Natronolimnohabitans innermongolicus JCM 12255 TaxID=1227499 RepID=L9X752_9EURY|nr:hypothetical protein [Natronolimnohabitans innermongolicus]ELY57604.1 hypothetical protein C493_08981 [Natronolimnohabitans innermongolicus JCM 12255]
MSNPSPAGEQTKGDQHDEAPPEPPAEQRERDVGLGYTLEQVLPQHAAGIRKTGFWGAIVLPIAYLPLLAYGLSSSFLLVVFLVLVTVHLLALYVGHAHRRDDRT